MSCGTEHHHRHSKNKDSELVFLIATPRCLYKDENTNNGNKKNSFRVFVFDLVAALDFVVSVTVVLGIVVAVVLSSCRQHTM